MSLTLGSVAPLGRPTGGTLNIEIPDRPAHLLYLHDVAGRIRGDLDGTTVVDATAARMLHETGLLPRWYFPRDSVRADMLEPSSTTTHCPFKGDALYWNVRVGDKVIADALWEYPEVVAGAPDLSGLLSPYMEKFDRWWDEDEEVHEHPRDPFHRVDARRSSAHVVVRSGGEVVADTGAPVAVKETGLPVRWYVPLGDVDAALLTETSTETYCPYKGVASYWTLEVGEQRFEDAVWTYREPLLEAVPAKGCVCFLADGIETEVTR
ncbi:MAG TPA: DUF427 domain-containing protein [Acidimicrobiales bacterium]|jgi:uncharacterized protein (DUF427 family)|nr:DUF427 domain-containing protein [Acidimicrobiales bacterium]